MTAATNKKTSMAEMIDAMKVKARDAARANGAPVLDNHQIHSNYPLATLPDTNVVAVAPSAPTSGYIAVKDLGRAVQPGDHIAINPHELQDNPRNPRIFYKATDLKSLTESISSLGQQTPIQAYKNQQGQLVLKSGHRRKRALIAAKRDAHVDVVLPPDSVLDEFREARSANVEQKAQSYVDDAIRFNELIDSEIVSSAEDLNTQLGLGMTKVDLSKLLSITKMPLSLLEALALKSDEINKSAAYWIYRYYDKTKDESRVLKLLDRVAEQQLSVRYLEQYVGGAGLDQSGKPDTRTRSLARAAVSGSAKGELKMFDTRLELKLGIEDNARRDQIYQRILVVLKEEGLNIKAGGFSSAE